MSKIPYMFLNGEIATADDPKRGMFYASGCSFFTDNWAHLGRNGDIPACPFCKSVGFQCDWDEWWVGAAKFEQEREPDNKGYVDFLKSVIATCHGRQFSILKLWANYRNNGRLPARIAEIGQRLGGEIYTPVWLP